MTGTCRRESGGQQTPVRSLSPAFACPPPAAAGARACPAPTSLLSTDTWCGTTDGWLDALNSGQVQALGFACFETFLRTKWVRRAGHQRCWPLHLVPQPRHALPWCRRWRTPACPATHEGAATLDWSSPAVPCYPGAFLSGCTPASGLLLFLHRAPRSAAEACRMLRRRQCPCRNLALTSPERTSLYKHVG